MRSQIAQTKATIRLILRPILLRNRRVAKLFNRKYFGLNELDRLIENFVPKDGGYFVELGANDGVTQSNTKYFELYRNWHGVLVEPIPSKFLECKKNRSKRNFFAQAACVSLGFNEAYVRLIYSNLMTTSLSGESDLQNRRSHAQLGESYLMGNEKVEEFLAPAKTLTSILDEAQAPKMIDLLSLDVEGNEIEVLKGIDHTKYKFYLMCVECRNFEKLNEYLSSNQYEFVSQLTPHDYLFKSR